MKSPSLLVQKLQQKGWRITPARRALAEILSAQQQPLNVGDILLMMASRRLAPNKTTIYREIERLKEEGVIREVLIDGKSQYVERIDESDHHHHLICHHCKRLEDFEAPKEVEKKINELIALVQKQTHFGTINHSVDFFGVCLACREKKT